MDCDKDHETGKWFFADFPRKCLLSPERMLFFFARHRRPDGVPVGLLLDVLESNRDETAALYAISHPACPSEARLAWLYKNLKRRLELPRGRARLRSCQTIFQTKRRVA
jgi:hypothetical protein